jgi:gliding motility-associated-like protein
MLIYNRWGELIYETYSLDDKWNGYYEGRPVQQDVYVYTALWQDIMEKWGSKTGTVTVLY